ncbi:TIGR02466 family protein [Leptolyngbya sp. GGD]|uniref:TIGR02466 family protein n=1 Tax=Leptolyngbya sp. GGD TaxID=2997907 RepID=UPI00227D29E4|nr:TIGR02466 family protein [Leptolyngbya sp. GGD]MCY6492558.1 TIGR02466 family protein [Leptolyngbya sp. GGD]
MPIETWFPLAIYYDDLPDASEHQQALLDAVMQLEHQGAEPRNYPEMAWTGDLHGVEQIHTYPAFSWIVKQVELHVATYLQEVGVDLSKVDLYIQRAWPIISRPDQGVGAHCHNTAHVSAVYYIKVPTGEMSDPGSLVFFNDARVNEVSPGLGSENTDIVDADNYLNQLDTAYAPVEGRLIIFPAKQRHAVTMNETDEVRVSLSFDIVLTATGKAAGAYEFLTPPPNQWRKFFA